MNRSLLKKIGLGLGGVFALLVLLVVYLAVTFNPNDYKSTVIALVKEKKQRTLTINGDIKLSFWPKIGADLGEITLSEYQSTTPFASIKSAKVALAVLPLLKKQIVVDTVYLDGAQVAVIQRKDGSFNFDDLLSKEEEDPSQPIDFDVQGVQITNTQASFTQEATGARYQVDALKLTTGQVALKTPFDVSLDMHVTANQPVVDAMAKLRANVMVDPEGKHYVVKQLDTTIAGDILDGKAVTLDAAGSVDVDAAQQALAVSALKISMQGDFQGLKREVRLEAPKLALNAKQVASDKVVLALKQEGLGQTVTVDVVLAALTGNQQGVESQALTADITQTAGARSLKGHFASPVKANLTDLIIDVPALAGQFDIKDPAVPNGQMQGQFKLSAHADVKQETANSQFQLALADTQLAGQVNVAGFKTPQIGFKLNADTLNLTALLGKPTAQPAAATRQPKASAQAADLSALRTLFLDGSVHISKIIYQPYTLTGLNVGIKADGQQLALQGLDVKLDDTRIQGQFAISQFAKPLYSFNLNVDKLDLNRYLPPQSAAATDNPAKKADAPEQPFDLSPLKALNAQGNIRVGWLKYGKTEAKNINIGMKANDGVARLNPLDVDIYQGSVRGQVQLDARATPKLQMVQTLQNISVGQLLSETINNDMLSGNGNLNLEVTAQGNTVTALKKSLAGSMSLMMADGAVKGIDIAGTIRDAKSKLNVLKGEANTAADQSKKTDFSELTASFQIKNGVARNDDLAMKAPIFRLPKGESRGEIDIGNERLNYLAKPTLVNSLKGQGGKEADQLSSVSIPIKVTGTFAAPKFNIDMAAMGQALAKSAAIDALSNKLGGDKAGAVKSLIGSDNKTDALKGLLGGGANQDQSATNPEATPKEAQPPKEELKQKALKKLLNF